MLHLVRFIRPRLVDGHRPRGSFFRLSHLPIPVSLSVAVSNGVRSLSTDANYRELIADKTAASNERISGAITVMNLNKEVIEKAVGGIKTDVGDIKVDVEKAMLSIKIDMKEVLTQEIKVLKTELSEKVSAMRESIKILEKLVFASMAVFIFGKQIGSGISEVVEASKAGVKLNKE
jgi:hypothetical protein